MAQVSLVRVLTQPKKVLQFAAVKFKENVLWDRYYQSLPEPKTKAWIPHDPHIQRQIVAELKSSGYAVAPYTIDVADYRRYLEQANYSKFPGYYRGGTGHNFTEKSLEHYLATKFLDLRPDDVYIDIANAGSPVPEIYHELFGCAAYRQDLDFPQGLHKNVIGGDAARMPLPDGFAGKMALHCSFEHFENDSDIGFVREAGRVLRPGGRLFLAPLYLFKEYAIQTDPIVVPRARFDPEAVLYCARGYGNRHGRFYSVAQFTSRIRNNLGPLRLTIHVMENQHEVHPTCYVKFAALLEK